MNALPHTRDEKELRATQMLKVRARLSASGGLAQPGPLGEGPVVVALPRHRQPCHELLLRKAVRLRVDACPFLANGLNEVERLLSETAVGLDGEGREGVSLALCKVLVLGGLGVLAHDERMTCHSVKLAFDRGGKGVPDTSTWTAPLAMTIRRSGTFESARLGMIEIMHFVLLLLLF